MQASVPSDVKGTATPQEATRGHLRQWKVRYGGGASSILSPWALRDIFFRGEQ